jgi:hypothetical protein
MERRTAAKAPQPPARGSQLQRKCAKSTPAGIPLLQLQQSIGYQAVQRLISSPYIQTKLQVSTPGDPFEQEADRVADTVMRMAQPKPVTDEKEKEKPLQAKPLATGISRLAQRATEKSLEKEKQKLVAAPLIQQLPLAVRDDDEQKVKRKLDPESNSKAEEKEKILATRSAKDTPFQRHTLEDEKPKKETMAGAPLIQRQMDEEELEETAQPTFLSRQTLQAVDGSSVSCTGHCPIQKACTKCANERQPGAAQPDVRVRRKAARRELPDDVVDDKQTVQSKGAQTFAARNTTSLAVDIHALNGGGSPLPDTTRAFFEPRFGADFSSVRVHTDSRAAQTASYINAKAFTVGQNIAFGPGRYSPHSDQGRHLLAHELTHVVQQSPVLTQNSIGRHSADARTAGQDQIRSSPEVPGGATAGRGLASTLTATARNPSALALTIGVVAGTGHSPVSRVIQRNVLSDIWEGITEAAPAVTAALQLVAGLIANPTRLPMVLAAIAWGQIPERFLGPIIDRVLQVCLTLARNVEMPSPPGISIGTILQHAAIGFLERALSYPTGMKVRVVNRIARIVVAPSWDFSIGFLKGLVLGLWDGLTGPFILLWDLIKMAYEICEAQLKFIQRLLNREQREQLGNDVKTALDDIGKKLAQAVAQLMTGRTNPLAILRFVDRLINTVLQQVESLGASLADSMLRFMNKPDRELGESIGWVEGTLTFEVLLLILTEGGYTAIKNGLEGLKVVVRLIQMGGRAWEALRPVRAALAAFRVFAKANRALAPLLEAVEGVFGLLAKFLRFSFGMGGPGGAATRGAEHAGGVAERGASREIHVADTATRESHEITLLGDGRLIRCSDGCLQIADSILERSGRFEHSGLQVEGRRLNGEARRLSDEARALKANESLSAAERETQEAALMRRVEALERQMAAAEQRLMESLSEGAGTALESVRTFRRENSATTHLNEFDHEIRQLNVDLERNRALASEALDPEMRQLVEGEFRDLERRARDLETRMRSKVPATAPVVEPGTVPRPHLSYPKSHLPTTGKRSYRSPGPGEVVQHPQGEGYLDILGNKWQVDRTKARTGRFFEWDVQHPNGLHTNVGIDGTVTHGPDNF